MPSPSLPPKARGERNYESVGKFTVQSIGSPEDRDVITGL